MDKFSNFEKYELLEQESQFYIQKICLKNTKNIWMSTRLDIWAQKLGFFNIFCLFFGSNFLWTVYVADLKKKFKNLF